MAPTIRAIETVYNGYRFRSRLEARWAVFMDSLGVRYEYEPQGFDLGGTCYLPDFWLPDLESWLEIKGPEIERYSPEWDKAILLCDATEQDVFMFSGQFPTTAGNLMGLRFSVWTRYDNDGNETLEIEPDHIWWFRCPICSSVQMGKTIEDLPCGCVAGYHPDNDPVVREASLIARQARFERF